MHHDNSPNARRWDTFSAMLNDTEHGSGFGNVDPDADLDTLVAYHRGQLDAHEAEAFQRCLVQSPALVAELLDLEAFAAPTPSAQASCDLDQAWQDLETRIEADAPQVAATPAPVVDFATRRHQRPVTRRWWVAAAAAIAAVVGFQLVGPEHGSIPDPSDATVAHFEGGDLDAGWTLTASNQDGEPIFATDFEGDLNAWGGGTAREQGSTLDEQRFEQRDLGGGWRLVAENEA